MPDEQAQAPIPDKRWATKYPELGTGPLPAEPYLSAEYFALERERVFRRAWINVGHVSEIPEVGDFFVREIAMLGVSLLLVRGRDGSVRGFHNVCSHRGNILAYEERGQCKGYLTCNFHGWAYDLQGTLKHVPDEDNFAALDRDRLGLSPVATDVWNGFIFTGLAPEKPLLEFLGPLAERLNGGDWEQYRFKRQYTVDERCNWKIALDAQNDGYHVAWQHRRLMPNRFVTNAKGATRGSEFASLGDHCLTAAGIGPAFRPTPLEGAMWQIDQTERACRVPLKNGFEFFHVFPNFVMIFFRGPSHDACLTQNFWPLAVDRTRWEIRFYAPQPQNAAALIAQDFIEVFNRIVFDEDATAHEHVQHGLASGAKKEIWLQDEEIGIRHFHHALDRMIARG